MPNYAVTLLSGGLDSTTVAVQALQESNNLSAITFHYGQSHSKEVACAQEIAGVLDIQHQLLDISFLGQVAWYSALTNPDHFPVPENSSLDQMGTSIPITYVPLRNTIFLSLAAAYLESRVLYAIEKDGVSPDEVEAQLYMAPNAIDYSGYPDCRPEYFEKMTDTLNYGSKLWTEYKIPIQVKTPIIELSKMEIVKLGLRLKAPLELTWSCYQGGEAPCGSCDSCLLRAKGFDEAGVPDPALTYRRQS
jgi:7-cyano-7-deazaguanine synthase